MKAFFAILKEDKLKDSKEISLEGTNHKCAFPKDKDTMGPELQDMMQRVFAALQRSPSEQSEVQFTQILGTVDTNDVACRDPGVDEAVNAILSRGQLTSQQRIFMFRAFLTEVMEKWMHVLQVATAKASGNGSNSTQQSIYVLVPQYIHRCVRVLRDVIDGHEESERKLIRDTLLTWLNKEVIAAFNGVEPPQKGQAEKPKTKNVFLPKCEGSGKESFAANLKGHLDKIQYGLKIFLVSLVVNGIIDLTQVLRFEVRERHILKDNDNIWFMSVIMKLLYREINTPPEISTNRIQLLKAEEIFESMNKWMIHRGGSIYLEVEMIRQHLKVSKRTKRRQSREASEPSVPSKLPLTVAGDESGFNYQLLLDTLESSTYKPDKDDQSSASEKIALFVQHRLFDRCVRPLFLAPSVGMNSSIEMQLAQRERTDLSLANLYASTMCSVASVQIATSIITAVVSRVLERLEEDAKATSEEEYLATFNGSIVSVFLRRILTWHNASNNLYLRFMRSIRFQLELLLGACQAYEATPSDFSLDYLAALRRKIGLRLQLISITASITSYTLPYRNGIVKLLFSLLGTAVVHEGVGVTLFSWILDLIPLIPCTIFSEHHHDDLVRALKLPDHLTRRVYAVFPKSPFGALPISMEGMREKVDPWALLDGVSDLPSKAVATASDAMYALKRQKIQT
ncbi:unnamed protein product [Aphanomyces euteiches]